MLDMAHQMNGAENSDGVSEAKINLSIALKIQHLLESSGATVILTRSDDNSICEIDAQTIGQKKISDIKNRVKIGNNSSADIFVSIHLNKISQSQYWGWQTFFNHNENSKRLSECIQSNLNDTISKDNNRVPHLLNSIYLMKKVEIPITVVECGFLSNYEESQKLVTDDYQNQIAWGIYTGIMDYFN